MRNIIDRNSIGLTIELLGNGIGTHGIHKAGINKMNANDIHHLMSV